VRAEHRSAAWGLSLRPTAAFAAVTTVAFILMYFIAAYSIREHNDAWLRGEAEVLRQVSSAAQSPELHVSLMQAVAAAAVRSITGASRDPGDREAMIFVLETAAGGREVVWLGPPRRGPFVEAVRAAELPAGKPRTVKIPGQRLPFRVVRHPVSDGEVYLGLSDLHAVHLMQDLLGRLALVWLAAVALAWLIAFLSARQLLARVESITTAAARIKSDDLSTRLPTSGQADEIGYLARTLNGMLDRIAGSVNQLRSLTDSVAHELKSPLTSIRGRLEIALTSEAPERCREATVQAIDDLDRLAAFVTTTLDVAEAEGSGLRLHAEPVDVGALVHNVVALYEPAFAERQQALRTTLAPETIAWLDASLVQRAVANLLDNELRHCPPDTTVDVTLTASRDEVTLRVEDDGPGFPVELHVRIFERFVKAGAGGGHGLGLAFTRAVVVAHGGRVSAENRVEGGALITLTLPRGH
jgi:signal transduction histidine kinase